MAARAYVGLPKHPLRPGPPPCSSDLLRYLPPQVDGLWKWLKLIPSYLSRPMVDPGKLTPRNRSVMGFNLIWLTERDARMTREVDEMCTRGGLLARPPAVGTTFDFGQLPDALSFLRSGANIGKVVVTVERAEWEDPNGRTRRSAV